MSQVRHLQSVILLIAKDIDALCRKNDIEYYLFGGSALGAKRHQGFIPWDDDLDIVMFPDQYEKFVKVCKTQLDTEKYTFQERLSDWPSSFSKIRLNGTHIQEVGEWNVPADKDGIYVDVFRLDYAANSKSGRIMQYIFGKLWLSHQLNQIGYVSDSRLKKLLSVMAKPLKNKAICNFVIRQYEKYNSRPTRWTSDTLGRTRFHNAFIPLSVYGKPVRVPFEDTLLPVHEDVHAYLSISYGDYMQLPPEEKRVGLHITSIDFGQY